MASKANSRKKVEILPENTPKYESLDIDLSTNDSVDEAIIASNNNNMQQLLKFLKDPSIITVKGDPKTNICVWHGNKIGTYNIPNEKLKTFFILLDNIRRDSIKFMINEKQEEYSGIMLDFDIYQESNKREYDGSALTKLIRFVLRILGQLIDLGTDDVYIGVTTKPKVLYNADRKCYKDGIHLLIPGIMIKREVKRLLLRKILEADVLVKIFGSIKLPTTMGPDYNANNFLDNNCAHVPVFFVGSSSKIGSVPYILSYIYVAEYGEDCVTNVPQYEVTDKTVSFKETPKSVLTNDRIQSDVVANICAEFSLTYIANDLVICKRKYEIVEAYVAELLRQQSSSGVDNGVGALMLAAVNNPEIEEIRNYLDILAAERYNDYALWIQVVFALANTSPMYKDLALYFSRKSEKFEEHKFDSLWNSAVCGKKNGLTLASIKWWASKDNTDAYNELLNKGVHRLISNMIYTNFRQGKFDHDEFAKVLKTLLPYKFAFDRPTGSKESFWYEFVTDEDTYLPGEIYKWRVISGVPTSMMNYMSNNMQNMLSNVLESIKVKARDTANPNAKFFGIVSKNFGASILKLSNNTFKKGVIAAAENIYNRVGFADALDREPYIRGVANGILKLSSAPDVRPMLIRGYHNHLISSYTNVEYVPFNPYDELTKKILKTFRLAFLDEEADTNEFFMHFLACSLDSTYKDPMLVMYKSLGGSGSSTIAEEMKNMLGLRRYGITLPMTLLTSSGRDAESASPMLMQLEHATFVTFNESGQGDVLRTEIIKKLLSGESMLVRGLYMVPKPIRTKCVYLITTNKDLEIPDMDYGVERRIYYIQSRVQFLDKTRFKITDPKTQRYADDKINKLWPEDPQILSRFLSIMVWFHYSLISKYKGQVTNVDHPHIRHDTAEYIKRQDKITLFISSRCVYVQDDTAEFDMIKELQKYRDWHFAKYNESADKNTENAFIASSIKKHIIETARGKFLKGIRFLEKNQKIGHDERWFIEAKYTAEMLQSNWVETPDQYYERICKEYDSIKHVFASNGDDTDYIQIPMNTESKLYEAPVAKPVKYDVSSTGLVIRKMPEPIADPHTSQEDINDAHNLFDFVKGDVVINNDSDDENARNSEDE